MVDGLVELRAAIARLAGVDGELRKLLPRHPHQILCLLARHWSLVTGHSSLVTVLKPPQQADLPGMIHVMEGDTEDHPQSALGRLAHEISGDCSAQFHMLSLEQGAILSPGLFYCLPRLRPSEPVAALERKRAARSAQQPPSNGVFPVGGMNGDFPDIVTAGLWSPCRLPR